MLAFKAFILGLCISDRDLYFPTLTPPGYSILIIISELETFFTPVRNTQLVQFSRPSPSTFRLITSLRRCAVEIERLITSTQASLILLPSYGLYSFTPFGGSSEETYPILN